MVYIISDIFVSTVLIVLMYNLFKKSKYRKFNTVLSASVIIFVITSIIMIIAYNNVGEDYTMGNFGLEDIAWEIYVVFISACLMVLLTIIAMIIYRKKLIMIYKSWGGPSQPKEVTLEDESTKQL